MISAGKNLSVHFRSLVPSCLAHPCSCLAVAILVLYGLNGAAGAAPEMTRHSPREMTRAEWGVSTWGFERNLGQADAAVDYICRGSQWQLLLEGANARILLTPPSAVEAKAAIPPTASSSSVQPRPHLVKMKLLEATQKPLTTGDQRLPGYVNYYVGRDPGAWRERIPTFAKVRKHQVYPGVDVVYYGNPNSLEFDFVLAAGVNPQTIRLGFEGVDQVRLAENGALELHTPAGILALRAPHVYQEVPGGEACLRAQYLLRENDGVEFSVSDYDPQKPLVIDPVLEFSTYFGGHAADKCLGVEVAPDGAIYVIGSTFSSDFPVTPDALQTNQTYSAMNFVAKFDATGRQLLHATYLGNMQYQANLAGFTLNGAGEPILTGYAWDDFPMTSGSISTTAVYGAIYVLKLDPTGKLVFSSFIDGPNNEYGRDVAVDSTGNIYVLAQLWGPATLPMVNSFQSAGAGREEAALFKLNPTASAILYSSYLGGTQRDYPRAIAADNNGNAYLAGNTTSTDFPLKQSPQAGNAGNGDVFVAKFNTLASGAASLVYSRYFGGVGADGVLDIDVDLAGNAYLCGGTSSSNSFPLTASAFQGTYGGDGQYAAGDAFVAKIGPTGLTLYATFLGGLDEDSAVGIRVDRPRGIVYTIGSTRSQNFPLTNAIQTTFSGPCGLLGLGCAADIFIAELDPTIPGRSGLLFSTYLGGAQSDDAGIDIALSPSGEMVGIGLASRNFPVTTGAYRTQPAGADDVVLFKLGPGAKLEVEKHGPPPPAHREQELTYTIVVSNRGPGTASNVIVQDCLPLGLVFRSATASQGSCSESNGTITCELGSIPNGAAATLNVTVMAALEGLLTNSVTVTSPSDPVIASQPVSTVTSVLPPLDGDNDGLPDWWELKFFGHATNMLPGGNEDGDDLSNQEEYVADTDPTVMDGFAVLGLSHETAPKITLHSSMLRIYSLESSTNLSLNAWETVSSNLLGNGGVLTLTHTNDADFRAYRLRVSVPGKP